MMVNRLGGFIYIYIYVCVCVVCETGTWYFKNVTVSSQGLIFINYTIGGINAVQYVHRTAKL